MKRIRRVSQKQRVKNRQLADVRSEVFERARGFCEGQAKRRLGSCSGVGVHAHHVLPRSQGGPHTLENLLWLCIAHHDFAHANPREAYECGLLKRRAVYEMQGK